MSQTLWDRRALSTPSSFRTAAVSAPHPSLFCMRDASQDGAACFIAAHSRELAPPPFAQTLNGGRQLGQPAPSRRSSRSSAQPSAQCTNLRLWICTGRDLVNMAKKRPNIVPIIEDARHPQKYRMLVPMVDVIFADVAQPDQVCLSTLVFCWRLPSHTVGSKVCARHRSAGHSKHCACEPSYLQLWCDMVFVLRRQKMDI